MFSKALFKFQKWNFIPDKSHDKTRNYCKQRISSGVFLKLLQELITKHLKAIHSLAIGLRENSMQAFVNIGQTTVTQRNVKKLLEELRQTIFGKHTWSKEFWTNSWNIFGFYSMRNHTKSWKICSNNCKKAQRLLYYAMKNLFENVL